MDNSHHDKFSAFITKNITQLASKTKVDGNFLDCLVSANCLSLPQRGAILVDGVNYNRSSKLYLEELVPQGPSTLPKIIHALKETKQNDLVDFLEKEGHEFLMNIPSSSDPANSLGQNPDARELVPKKNFGSYSREPTFANCPPVQETALKLQRFQPPVSQTDAAAEDLYASGILTKYRIESSPKGFALIINMIEFENSPSHYREGAIYDTNKLGTLLHDFGYDVFPKENLSLKDFLKVIELFLEEFSKLQVDSCIVSIMTHGEHGDIIMTKDNKWISVKEVLEKFNNVNCPQLNGKPKIFFMQHCRGREIDKGASVVADAILTDAPGGPQVITVPTWTDMLVCYSTLEGHYSFRKKDQGTWFIQIVCEVFRKYSNKLDICKMLNLVAKEMSEKATGTVKLPNNVSEKGLKQICPYYNIGFSSDFYFQTQRK